MKTVHVHFLYLNQVEAVDFDQEDRHLDNCSN